MLKMNQIYIRIEEDFFNDIRMSLYVCDYKDSFEKCTKDWNCDNDVYTMTGQYMTIAGKSYRDFITKDDFIDNFYEFNPKEVSYILDTKSMIVYNKLQKIKHNGIIYIYLENSFTKTIVTIEKFKSQFKEVK